MKRLFNYARVKPSKRPKITLRIELRRNLCFRCIAPVSVTMWEDDAEDPLDDHKDGIIILNKADVNVVAGGTSSAVDATARVYDFRVLTGNP